MTWPIIEANNGAYAVINDQPLVNFTSNDYLGLADNNELKQCIATAILEHGVGATGSRRLSGNHRYFLDAEATVAQWVGKEAGVMFNSGYQMNSEIFRALFSKSTLIIADKLIHASVIDGIRNSDAQLMRFRHNDMDHLSQLLKKYAHKYSEIVIGCEAIYSMDGDIAPLNDIIELKHKYQATLIVDEAHSIGLYGHGGSGWVNQCGYINDVDMLVVPFGKAFGLSGAMLLSNNEIAHQLMLISKIML